MNRNPRINLDMTTMDAAVAMAEGNPGAASVCGQLLQDTMGIIDLCHLDDMGLYGPNIWLAYKDICQEDIEKLKLKIRNRSIKEEVEALPYYTKEY